MMGGSDTKYIFLFFRRLNFNLEATRRSECLRRDYHSLVERWCIRNRICMLGNVFFFFTGDPRASWDYIIQSFFLFYLWFSACINLITGWQILRSKVASLSTQSVDSLWRCFMCLFFSCSRDELMSYCLCYFIHFFFACLFPFSLTIMIVCLSNGLQEWRSL